MFDLNEQPQLPSYELKLRDGSVKSFDPLLVSYKLRVLDEEVDPVKIQGIINKVFEIDVDAISAMLIVKDFTEFSEEHLEEPLKKVFGAEPFSATSTDSAPVNSENSNQPSTSV